MAVQSSSDVDPAGETFPSGQGVQDSAPASLYVSLPHLIQPLLVMKLPALHSWEFVVDFSLQTALTLKV